MSDWTEGYVTQIGYTHGYYGELRPLAMRQALLNQSVEHRWPEKLRYLELGFGQGLSLNIHAAATSGEFWGCDFNPAQVANAQALAAASGADVTILESSFEELAARTDLPAFDVIALHGVWSWISEPNRRLIVDIVRRHLAAGGIFYISYNTTPGWSPSIPLRHLMTLHAERASPTSLGIAPRIDAAIAFAQSLIDANATYFRVNTVAAERLKTLKDQNRNYLAHEYFNADWHPMPFSDMAGYLAEAKLSFAGTVFLLDHIDAITLSADQQKILQGLPDTVLREQVRDYLVNQQFRRDLWVRGPRPLPATVQRALVVAQSFVLATAPEDIELKVRGAGSVIGDTTTIMMWIQGVSPVAVLDAFIASCVAFAVFAPVLSFHQQRHSPIARDTAAAAPDIDWPRGIIVLILLAAIFMVNVVANTFFSGLIGTLPLLGTGLWLAIVLTAPWRSPDWRVMRSSARGAAFLVALVATAAMMPVEQLPAASWQTAFGLGFVSAVFDNIPLTALALKQGGYDWGLLAFSVGYGGSMLWFGSSAGVALSALYPEVRSILRWLRFGWIVAAAYVIGFLLRLWVLGWQPG